MNIAPRAVRAARARALLALRQVAAGFTALSLFGCASLGQLDPKAQRAVDTMTCYVAVLTPYVGGALDTVQLVEDAVRGRADIGTALRLLGNTAEDVEFVAMALEACRTLPELAPPPPELAAR